MLLALGPVAVFAPNAVRGITFLFPNLDKKYTRKNISRSLERLEHKHLLSYYQRKDGKYVFEVSSAGKTKALMFQADEVWPKCPRRWDGTWRIIFSDISEKHKKGRDALRAKFNEWGMYPLQKSVFAYPFPCEEEMTIIRDLFHIPTQSLFIIETKSMPREKELKKHFHL